jgi:hypothetical protein
VNHCGRLIYETGGCWHGSTPSVPYNELSGFLSILLPPLLTLAGIALLWCWHSQCAVHRCYWPTTRRTATGERACWVHHPHPKRTVQDVHEAHYAHLRGLHHPPRHRPEVPRDASA